MKRITAALLCTLFCTSLFAQKDIPSFGKVDKADLEMKECPFDKAAEAMVLFDVAEVYCFFNLQSASTILSSQLERRVRIKILKTQGLDVANIHIPYISEKNIDEIKNLSAQTINLDASGNIVISKVEKKLIYEKKLNKRYSELVFAFPDVKPGSIIEYKYRDDATSLYALSNWFFQRKIPVLLSRYTLNFPVELTISAQPNGGLPVLMDQTSEGNRNIKTFTMREVPALRDEPFISCYEDYLQQVVPFMISLDISGYPSRSLQRTWPEIIKQLIEDEDFGIQLRKNIPRTSDLDAMLSNISDPYKKMLVIHDYVRKNMLWDNTYGIWALEGVKSAWRDKKGTSGEINLILVNLLKDADLDASPILLSTRENGRINTFLPGYYQFNKVMAYVSIDGKNYILDATNKYASVQLIPYDVLYSEGLLIKKLSTDLWGWKTLSDDDHLFENSTNVIAAIDDKGLLSGDAMIVSKGYSRLTRMPKLKDGKEKFIETYFAPGEQNINIDSLDLQNEEVDSLPLIQQLKFSQKINISGDYNYFSVNLFTGFEKNPFIADTRVSDIFFGAKQQYTLTGSYTIPTGYTFDALPKNTRMRLPDTSIVFTRYSSTDDRTLSVRIVIEFKKPVYAAENYDEFHDFYKKLFAFLNEQYVYKKK